MSSGSSARGSVATLPVSAVAPELAPGTRIGGRYRVIRWLGRGGMGSVYEVEDTALGAVVALKTAEGDLWDAGTVAQLKREIMLARRVTHPNVCRVHDFGSHALPAGQAVPFLTMELVRGETLAALLAREGPLPPERVVALLDPIAAALDAAHEAGVVHRDFKTGNVMIVGERPLVTDFGLAVEVAREAREGEAGPGGGALVGTPAYMAPEQVSGAPITRATDVYALGVVLYELLSGRLPFEGTTSIDVATRRLHQPPTPLSAHRPALAPIWERVIARCLRIDPAARWASCGDVARAARGERASAPPIEVAPPSAPRAEAPRALALVIATGVRDARVVERAVVKSAGVLLAPEPGRLEAVVGAQRSLGDEIDRALAIARAAAKVSAHVAIAIGRAVLREGHVEGDARDEAEGALAAAARGLVAGDRTALALATRAELEPVATGVHRVGASRRSAAPLVGRDAELAMLRRACDAAIDERRALATWVVGPPGIGKSRLLEAAAAIAAERGMAVHVARAGAEHGRAMELFPGATRATTPIAPFDPRATLTQSLAMRDDPQALADRLRAEAIAALERLAGSGPLALVLDHVQWADEASAQLLEELPSILPDRAVWIVLGARDEIADTRPGLLGALDVAARLEPSALRANDVAELARITLGSAPSASFVQALVERTGGDPLFVEQLLPLLAPFAGSEGGIAEAPVPATVELAVQARLDRLPERERECVALLALYGRAASARELEGLGLAGAQRELASLARRSLVARAASEGGAYRVRTQLVADVAYRGIADAHRIALHARAADVARENGREAEDVARHLAHAGDRARAAELFARAALDAAARGDGRAVLRCGARAAELGMPAEQAFAVELARADAARFVGDPAAQAALLASAWAAAETDRERALVAGEQGEWLRRNRRWDEAIARLGDAIALARASGDPETVAIASARRAVTLVTTGRTDEARAALDALSLEGSSARARAVVEDVRGYLATSVGDLAAQRRAYAAAAALYAQAGDARREAGAASNLADAENRVGRYEQAELGFRRALELARRVGNRLTEGYAQLNLGYALAGAGRTDEAQAALAKAAAIARAIGDPHLEIGSRLYAARARLSIAIDPAIVGELEAIAAEARGDATLEANALALAARAALSLGDLARACGAADRALAIRAARGSIEEGEGDLFLAAARAYAAAGRTADAERARSAGRARVRELADRIADPEARASFLDRIASHRELARG